MNYEIVKKVKRDFSLLILLLGFIIIFIVAKKAYWLEEWNTIAASLAVMVALITVYISLRVTWENEDEQEPELIISWDFKSNLIANLIIENIGGGKAYEVSIIWKKELKNVLGKPVSFGTIPFLAKSQKVKTVVNFQPSIWSNAKEFGEDNDNFIGVITYKRRKKSKSYQKKEFCISLGHKRIRSDYEDYEQEFYAQGKILVKEMKNINSNMKELINILKSEEK